MSKCHFFYDILTKIFQQKKVTFGHKKQNIFHKIFDIFFGRLFLPVNEEKKEVRTSIRNHLFQYNVQKVVIYLKCDIKSVSFLFFENFGSFHYYFGYK